jgi:hypothetical protein
MAFCGTSRRPVEDDPLAIPGPELHLHGIDAIAVMAAVREHGIAAVEAGVFAGAARAAPSG